ncbi:hypothetical protein [Natrinema sp. DC36]|uniref:hypothetical protein n=1 Tax=Natrinema sp. DC36 TaxID=2878680 RepID=UPI001CF02355|nr:hypothetical protein [Natrinema sp. DC36]
MTFNPSIADGAQLLDIVQYQMALNGYHLLDPDGASVDPGSSNLTVDVTFSTQARLGGPAEAVSNASGVSLPSSDPDNPRKALVYLDDAGTIQTLGGEPAAADPSNEQGTRTGVPTVPIPSGAFIPLAEVWIGAGVSDISSSDISSRRIPFSQGEGSGINADYIRGQGIGAFDPPIYGLGVDGEIIRSSNTTESTRFFAERYVVEQGATVQSSEGVIAVHATDEIVIDGSIDVSGDGASGGTGGDGHSRSSSSDGDDGEPGTDGSLGDLVGDSQFKSGGDGGAGGDYITNDGGASVPGADLGGQEYADNSPEWEDFGLNRGSIFDSLMNLALIAGAGGGGGASGSPGGTSGSTSGSQGRSGHGGDAGDGGGVVFLKAPYVEIDGSVLAEGTDGQDGGNGVPPDGSGYSGHGGGGGGGGGAGGCIIILAREFVINGSVSVSGGQPGTGGAGTAGSGESDTEPGKDGQAGQAGIDGRIILIGTDGQ